MSPVDDSITHGEDLVVVSPDGAVVAVIEGPDAGRSAPVPGRVGDVMKVGKAADSHLVLTDPAVSRQHFVLERRESGVFVKDVGSRNGIRVNGVRVNDALVEPGTVIQVGSTELLVRVATTGLVVPPSPRDVFFGARGKSLAMRRIFGLLERAAGTTATILLLGETGTGKDLLARAVHAASPRAKGPFEVFDCAAVVPSLIESELFGHEKGSFTGAIGMHVGAFERAAGGTIFLDELGELPLPLQAKLLRALEAREIRRVGGAKPVALDVRVVAATMRDLEAEVAAGRFRQDLYYRLAVVPILVPPLRARREDIPVLTELMLQTSPAPVTLAPEALARLQAHDWPGNVRELRNVLERAAVLAYACGETLLREVPLETSPVQEEQVAPFVGTWQFEDGTTYKDARERVEREFERHFVRWLLGKTGGNISAAAREAKMNRKYLGELVRKHDLKAEGGDG